MGFNRSSAVSELLGLEDFVVTERLWELAQWTLWVEHQPSGPASLWRLLGTPTANGGERLLAEHVDPEFKALERRGPLD